MRPPACRALSPFRFKAAIAFIFVTGVLDVMTMGLVTPVLPALIEDFAGSTGACGHMERGARRAVGCMMQFLCLVDHRLAVGPLWAAASHIDLGGRPFLRSTGC